MRLAVLVAGGVLDELAVCVRGRVPVGAVVGRVCGLLSGSRVRNSGDMRGREHRPCSLFESQALRQ